MLTRRSLPATAAAAAALLAGAAIAPPAADAQIGVQRERNVPTAYAITNARIVPGTGATIERGTVVVRDGLITAVGANVAAPADARTIDGTGLTVYPGFVESFGSLGVPAPRSGGGGGGGQNFFMGQQQQPSGPSGAPNSLRPAGQQPEVAVVDLLDPDADAFDAAHAAGFTAAHTAPANGIFAGQSAVIALRDGDARAIVLRAPAAMHLGFSAGRGFGGGYPNSLMGVMAVLRQTLLDAQHYRAEQAAYAANPRGMRRPTTDPSLEALQPVLAREVPIVMQANAQREIERALDLAKEFNLRVMIAGGAEAYRIAERLKAENVPVLLSLDFPEKPANRSADAAPEPVRVLRERVEAPRSPAKLADAGVPVAFTSGGDYAQFLANLQKAVENGLSREQALRALTRTPAELLGVGQRLGTVEAGKVANLTLVRGDVFAAGSRVAQLFVDGEPVEVRAPAARGDRAATAAGTWTVTVTLDGTDRAITLGLQQEASGTLRGTLQGALGTAQLSSGTFADSTIAFSVPITLPEGTEEATFEGTLTGNTIRGTVRIVGHDPGTFVGTRPNAGEATPGARRAGAPAATRPPR
jgi:imidazolonepropionase-like amidohydrolase